MNNSLLSRIVLCTCLVMSTSLSALEFRVTQGQATVETAQDSNKPFEVLETVIAPSFVSGAIGFGQDVGSLYLQIASKKRSKVRIEYDNGDTLFPLIDLGEVIFDRPGKTRTINFNVFGPVFGNLRIFNEKNQLIKTIPYIVLRERSYRQSIRTNVTESRSSDDNEVKQSISIGYTISNKILNTTDPYWSFSTSINTDVNDPRSRTTSAGISYSW